VEAAAVGSVLPAKRPISQLEQFCRERQERDLQLAYGGRRRLRDPRDTSHPRGLWFDYEAGDYVVRWIEKFGRHHKGEWAGRPLLLEEWQRENVRTIFGWKRQDETRRFRKAWWHTARKNGKTQIAGGVGLFLLVGDGEPGAEVYTTATKKEQAAICHEAARQMARRSPELREVVKVPKNKLANLTFDATGSFMAILASDHGTLDGLNPHGDLRDEVAEWTSHELAEVLDTASGARRQPLTLEITTAGVYDEEGVGYKAHDYAVNVLNGTIEDDALFAFIAAAEDGDDPFDPATWWKASPNLGVSLKLEYMQDQARKARNQPRKLNAFLQKLLNQWTQQVTRWLAPGQWIPCHRKDFDETKFHGRECIGGLDLSSVTDLSAFVLVFQDPDGTIDVLCRFWLPEATIEAASEEGRDYYAEWEKAGFLTSTPGNVIDYDFIRAEINELAKRFKIKEIAYDPYNATQISNNLIADGFTLVLTRQGFLTLSEPAKLLEVKVGSGKLRHGSPVLRWNGLNVSVVTDSAGNIKPHKDIKRALKIDGISALVTALSRIVGAEPQKPNPYKNSGILVLR
jgi:phage terminase large subunit-like protein